MNPTLLIGLAAIPTLILTYSLGKTIGKTQTRYWNKVAANLAVENAILHERLEDSEEDNAIIRMNLIEAGRKLADCQCTHRLHPAMTSHVFHMDLDEFPHHFTDGENK
jgi:hypothetical protein